MAPRRLRPLIVLVLPLLARSEINSFTLSRSPCSAGSIFDIAGLVCAKCDDDAGLQPDPLFAAYNDSPLKCSCPRIHLQAPVECNVDSLREGTCLETVCTSECSSSSKQVSVDQRQCVPCSAAGDSSLPVFDAESKQCSCNNPSKGPPTGTSVVTSRLVEIYDEASGRPIEYDCQRCKEGTAVVSANLYDEGKDYFSTVGTRYSADSTVCQTCPDPNMFFDTDYNCRCIEGFTLTGEAAIGHQSCIERYPTVSRNFARAIFKRPTSIDFSLDSIIYSHFYLRAASLCEFFQGASGDSLQSCQTLGNLCVMNMYDRDSAACEQYLRISERRSGTYHNQEGWKETLPWLYLSDDEAVRNDKGIVMKMAFNADNNASSDISFKLAKYKLDGSFVGIEDVTTQFQYCSGSNENEEQIWSKFGKGYRIENDCNINRLLDKEMYFYDMYLVDKEACSSDSVNNFDCLYPVPVLNRNLVENDVFPNMNLSTLDESDDKYTRRFFLFDNQSGRTSSGLEAIRFAKSIMLSIQVRSSDPTRLAPPILIIEYATETIDTSSVDTSIITDLLLFKVDYSMTTDNFWESLQILIGFVAALAVVVYGVKMNNWQSRQQQNPPNQQDESLTSMKFVVHAFVVLCHVFVLLFFPFVVAVCSYWYIFFKLQDSVFLLLPIDNEFYMDVGNEYYFLWLSFQGLLVCQTVYILFTIIRQCRSTVIFVDWERSKGRINNQVSTWRRVLVANEYLSLHTSRKHSIAFNLALVGFLASFDDADNGRVNIALRFAQTCFFWGIASCIQWIWRFVFYDRFYSEPRGQRFVDLCSVSNISVFVLTEKYKGFYIHGRSPYQNSDCSMEELLESFRKEANGFTVGRGLDAASQGDQVFVLYCSGAFRNQIDRIYGLTRDTESDSHVGTAAMSNFLKGFIDQQPPPTQEGLKYAVREPLVSESVFGLTPADFRQSDPKCIMQPDHTNWNRDYQFLSSTFQGIELHLLLHDILIYNAVDLLFNNTAASIFVTYVIHLARKILTSYCAKKNLSITSHIDERFLL